MASFSDPVAVPPTSAYGPRPVDFSILGDLYNTYQRSQLTDQQKQENALVIARQRAALEQEQAMRGLFSGGLPTDKSGNIDYQAVAQALAKAGNVNALTQLYPAIQGQQAGQPSPLLSGGTAPAGAPAATPPPARTGDLRPTSRSPQGDQPGSVMEVVAGKVGDADAGRIANAIAAKIGVDPNAGLTLGQKKRAMVLLDRELAANAPATPENAPQAAPGPPSVGAVTPAAPAAVSGQPPAAPVAPPPVAAQPAGAPRDAGVAGTPPVAASQPAAAGQPAQRITPTVPLPKGFTDPQQAILALRAEAARVGANPRAAPAMKALNDWADRIEGSQAPITVQPGQRIVSPTGQTLYASPERPVSVGGALVRPDTGEVVYRGTTSLSPEAVDDAARVYVQTGKFPPNMGRGQQGEATRNAILERASGMENELGLDPADRPARWQNYATHAAGVRVLEQRAANMTLVEQETRTLIPRVRALIDTVPRTNYPTLNKLILAAQEGTGDANVVKLGIAINSLIPVYARLLKPTGVIGVTDTENAKHILNVAWSKGQMKAALDQMEVERKAAADALAASRKEFGGGKTGSQEEGAAVGRPPDAMVGGKPAWRINGNWYDNPEGK